MDERFLRRLRDYLENSMSFSRRHAESLIERHAAAAISASPQSATIEDVAKTITDTENAQICGLIRQGR